MAVVLVLFGGGGKISRLMGDFGKGLKSFKKGMKEEEAEAVPEEGKKALKSEQAEEVSKPEPKKNEAQQG